MTLAHIAAVILGVLIIGAVLGSALQTVVLPRHGFTRIARIVFALTHRALVHPFGRDRHHDEQLALFAPTALVALPLVWMLTVTVGFAAIFWGIDSGSVTKSIEISGSSLFTLGFSEPSGAGRTWLTFVEATVGLGLVALLISYLPTIYSAYNTREKGLRVFRPFVRTPPSATALLQNLHRAGVLDNPDLWSTVWNWLIDVEQSHTSFPALCYFPVQTSGQSWVGTIGAVLDAAALLVAGSESEDGLSVRGPTLALAYGIPALGRISRAAALPVDEPHLLTELVGHDTEVPPPISVTTREFHAAIDALESARVIGPLDRDAAWRRYAWIRSGYDRALRGLAGLTGAAPAPWSSDRPAVVGRPRIIGRRPVSVDWTLPPSP